jgi:hypothetical protein
LPWPAQPYHRTDPNHRSIVSAIAVQTTLVTTRNTKPNPNIASARYSVPTVAPTPTNKAHAARPMRRMFSWKRRLARLQGGFGRDSIGGKHKLHPHKITSQQGRSATEPWHQGANYPVASDPWSRPTSCGATTDVGGPGQFRGLSFGEIGIPFRAPGRAHVQQAPCVTSRPHGRQNQMFGRQAFRRAGGGLLGGEAGRHIQGLLSRATCPPATGT